MQILSLTLRVQNRTLQQVKREGRIAFYELYGPNGTLYGFEVIIVKLHPAEAIRGKEYPEREGYSSNEDWGKLAWSYGRNFGEDAEQTFVRLCQKEAAGSLPETNLEGSEGKDSGAELNNVPESLQSISECKTEGR